MIGFIGGSGLYQLEDSAKEKVFPNTPYGAPAGEVLKFENFLFLARHGSGHRFPAHLVPYKANLWALKEAGAEAVVGVATVGSMDPQLPPGSFVIPTGIIDFSGTDTFYEGPAVHVDFTEPFEKSLRKLLALALEKLGYPFRAWGTYAATRGPRLETAQEIWFLKALGAHVVGMTVAREAALAREIGLPYAALCVVVNWAAGVAGPLSVDEMRKVLSGAKDKLYAIITLAAEKWPELRSE